MSDRATVSVETATPVGSEGGERQTTAPGTTRPSATLGEAPTAGSTTASPAPDGTTTADADGFGFGAALVGLALAIIGYARRRPGESEE